MQALHAQWRLVVEGNEQAHYAAKTPRAIDRREELERLSTLPTVVGKLNVGDYALVCVPPSSSSSSSAEPQCQDGPLPQERCVALFERKTFADHVASIRGADCRYHSQAQRLVASGCPHPYWVLIDAPPGSGWTAQDIAGVKKSCLHLATSYKPIEVLRLGNGDAEFGATILAICQYLDRDLFGGGSVPDLPLHAVVQESGAKQRLDAQPVVWLEQLTVPHGFSRATARAVAARYPDVLSLLRAWRRRSDEYATRGEDEPVQQRGKKRSSSSSSSVRKRVTLETYLDDALADLPLSDGKRLGPARSAMLRRVIVPDPLQLRHVRAGDDSE